MTSDNLTTQTIRRRLFLYLAASLLVLAFGLMSIISLTMFKELGKAADNNLTHICEVRSMTVAEWCRRGKDLARQITSRTRIRQELEKYNLGAISLDQLTDFTNPKLRDAMNLSDEIEGITRLDKQGRIVAQCGENLDSFDVIANRHYVSEQVEIIIPCRAETCDSVLISAPILNYSGIRQGTDIVLFTLNNLTKIIGNHDLMGAYDSIIIGYMVDGAPQTLIAYHQGDQTSQAAETAAKSNHLIARASSGESGLKHLGDIVASFKPVDESNWGIVITQYKKELYRPLYNHTLAIYSLSLLIYILILGGFWLALRPLAGRILLYSSELETKVKDKTEHLSEEIEERKKAEAEKQHTIVELQEALNNIKILKGLIPICANCKKIRDDQGFWSQFEEYIKAHSEAEFSHGICPECLNKYYPGVLEKSIEDNKQDGKVEKL